MPTPRRRLRLVMLQLRCSQLPLLQEQSSFIERCRVARHHSEMSEENLRQRIEFYREQYLPDPGDFDRLMCSLRPSVHADQILTSFLETYA